ncbi:Chromosome partition protein Smc [Carpediemonas membranifera]|uniref:Chromosome partition protein Smc n=1 Tax=Carpediemonas membranifera TaxID=201153 RepID=A0A8J6AR12_9EUKA|nr:Chromosome partition protein Smc [Carpediemonas membranifera]|eukprot:KAG9391708.1 Chromosome partition protein Smc [Carpediemonas membranifera]
MTDIKELFDDLEQEANAFDDYFGDAHFGGTPVTNLEQQSENTPKTTAPSKLSKTPGTISHSMNARMATITSTVEKYGISDISFDSSLASKRSLVDALDLLCNLAVGNQRAEQQMNDRVTQLEAGNARSSRDISHIQEELKKERLKSSARDSQLLDQRDVQAREMDTEAHARELVDLECRKMGRREQQYKHKLKRKETEHAKLREQLLSIQKKSSMSG